MSYVKAYLLTVVTLLGSLGFIFIIIQAIQLDPVALYMIYLSLFAGLSGPLRISIERSTNVK